MKLAKLILAAGLLVSIGAFAQSTPPATTAPTGSTAPTAEGHHHHHHMYKCMKETLAAQNLTFESATKEQRHAVKKECWQKFKAAHAAAGSTTPAN